MRAHACVRIGGAVGIVVRLAVDAIAPDDGTFDGTFDGPFDGPFDGTFASTVVGPEDGTFDGTFDGIFASTIVGPVGAAAVARIHQHCHSTHRRRRDFAEAQARRAWRV